MMLNSIPMGFVFQAKQSFLNTTRDLNSTNVRNRHILRQALFLLSFFLLSFFSIFFPPENSHLPVTKIGMLILMRGCGDDGYRRCRLTPSAGVAECKLSLSSVRVNSDEIDRQAEFMHNTNQTACSPRTPDRATSKIMSNNYHQAPG
jgi:hypothetical protein